MLSHPISCFFAVIFACICYRLAITINVSLSSLSSHLLSSLSYCFLLDMYILHRIFTLIQESLYHTTCVCLESSVSVEFLSFLRVAVESDLMGFGSAHLSMLITIRTSRLCVPFALHTFTGKQHRRLEHEFDGWISSIPRYRVRLLCVARRRSETPPSTIFNNPRILGTSCKHPRAAPCLVLLCSGTGVTRSLRDLRLLASLKRWRAISESTILFSRIKRSTPEC